MNHKKRIVIYHNPDDADAAMSRALELRAKNFGARIIDISNFSDIEDTDSIEFFDGVSDADRAKVEAAYKGERVKEVVTSDEDEISIPDDWEDLSFPELQKLAAALSDETVRSRDAALGIISAEIERRAEAADNDADDDLEGLTKAQLIEHAEEHEIDLGGATKKADILATIRAAHKE